MNDSDRQTMDQFIKKYSLTAKFDVAHSNPNMPDSDRMHHYKVTITSGIYSGHEFKVTFSMGEGIKHDPKLADVLDCIASDCSGYDNCDSFEDWATNYGYSPDSRKAERIYHTVAEQRKQFEHFLGFVGAEAYEELLYETEKL